jgi:hypothetical protein
VQASLRSGRRRAALDPVQLRVGGGAHVRVVGGPGALQAQAPQYGWQAELHRTHAAPKRHRPTAHGPRYVRRASGEW